MCTYIYVLLEHIFRRTWSTTIFPCMHFGELSCPTPCGLCWNMTLVSISINHCSMLSPSNLEFSLSFVLLYGSTISFDLCLACLVSYIWRLHWYFAELFIYLVVCSFPVHDSKSITRRLSSLLICVLDDPFVNKLIFVL